MRADRGKILERIRQLQQMTTKRGCTEAEAMSAAAKIAELMQENGLALGDVDFEQRAAPCRCGSFTSPRLQIAMEIGDCTASVATFHNNRDGKMFVSFVGRPPGPEIAAYLWDVCDRAIEREIATFKKEAFYRRRRSIATKRAAMADFTLGISARMQSRLQQLFKAQIAAGKDAQDEARQERDRRIANLKTIPQPEAKTRYGEAASAGYSAGGRVTLSHGIASGSESPVAQIGKVATDA